MDYVILTFEQMSDVNNGLKHLPSFGILCTVLNDARLRIVHQIIVLSQQGSTHFLPNTHFRETCNCSLNIITNYLFQYMSSMIHDVNTKCGIHVLYDIIPFLLRSARGFCYCSDIFLRIAEYMFRKFVSFLLKIKHFSIKTI